MAPVHQFITLNAFHTQHDCRELNVFECYVGQMNSAIFDVCELMWISLKHIM